MGGKDMKLQTKASFKKEYMALFHTKKFMVLALVIIGLSMLNPLMIVGLGNLMDSFSEVYDQLGVDVSELSSALGSSVSTGVSQAVMDTAQTGVIVFLLVINSNAGGEQKKRSIIIPSSSGLRSFSYIFPKFIVYPLVAFVLAIISAFAAWGISSLVYSYNDVYFWGVLLAGVLSGVCLMFYVCAHITIGTATGKAGMSATICIIASVLLPNLFAIFGEGLVYNPFTLNILAGTVIFNSGLSATYMLEVMATVLFTLAIMAILHFLALFAQNAKRIDNSGNEISI